MSRLSVVVVTLVGCGGPIGIAPVARELPAARTLSPGCAGSPYARIQDAINASASGDVIEVCPGTYSERLSISGKSVTLRSIGGAATTIVDATQGGRALSVTNGANVVVDGFTFRNGRTTTGKGGNVRCSASTLTLQGSVLEGGLGYQGGGLGMTSCAGLVQDNVFRDNVATQRGGGLYMSGTIDLLRNTFEANHSEVDAGAGYVKESWANIHDNVVIGNTSLDDGGGLFVYHGAPWVDGNTFTGNLSEEEGGGLRIKSSEAMITDNVFTDNHADWRGGATKISHNESVISGNTYVGNSSWSNGGAMLLFESASLLSFETFEGNTSDEGGAIAVIEGWDGPEIEDSVFDGNDADWGGHLYVELLGETVKLRRVDLLNGEADEGGAIYTIAGSDLDLRNVLFVGNHASVGGGVAALAGTTGEIYNAVAMWNDAPDGAAIRVTAGALFNVKNTVFTENTGGAAIRLISGTAPTFRYDDFYGNTSDFAGMASVVGINGNLAVSPGFVDAVGGDFTLLSTSALRNAGDPTLVDTDGSRSDLGRYGGPEAW